MVYRIESVRKNLNYAYQSMRRLKKDIDASRKDGGAVEYLGQQAGDILLRCRSCFDYAIKDILNISPDEDVRNIYFPFSFPSLENLKKKGLGDVDADYLFRILDNVLKEEMFDNRMTDYGIIIAINDMVNEEKHNKIHGVGRSRKTTTSIKTPLGVVSLRGWEEYDKRKHCYHVVGESLDMIGLPGVSVEKVDDYVFEFNGAFVDSFLENAIYATERLMQDIYSHLGKDPVSIDVNSSIPFDASERAFQKIFPIFCFPASVILFFENKGKLIFRYDETGSFVGVEGPGSILLDRQAEVLSSIIYELAASYVVPSAKRKISIEIREEWEKIASYDPNAIRGIGVDPSGKPMISLVIDGVSLGRFFIDAFGICMKFKNQRVPRSLGFDGSKIGEFFERLNNNSPCNLEIASSSSGGLPLFDIS